MSCLCIRKAGSNGSGSTPSSNLHLDIQKEMLMLRMIFVSTEQLRDLLFTHVCSDSKGTQWFFPPFQEPSTPFAIHVQSMFGLSDIQMFITCPRDLYELRPMPIEFPPYDQIAWDRGVAWPRNLSEDWIDPRIRFLVIYRCYIPDAPCEDFPPPQSQKVAMRVTETKDQISQVPGYVPS